MLMRPSKKREVPRGDLPVNSVPETYSKALAWAMKQANQRDMGDSVGYRRNST